VTANFTLQRLLGRKEDHLTAVFALAIELDQAFSRKCAHLLLAGLPAVTDGPPPDIAAVEVQRDFPLGTPDIVLTLTDGRLIAVENKLEAPETQTIVPGREDSSANQKTPQLAKYLKIPELDALAFIRATYKPPALDVLKNPRYLKPSSGRDHFLWRDFLPLMEGSEHPVTTWLAGAFRFNGFVPPDATIGDLDDLDRQRNFAQLWEPTADLARKLGWKVNPGSRKELYFADNPRSIANFVWANPTTGELQVRVHARAPDEVRQIRTRLEAIRHSLPEPHEPTIELAHVGRGTDRRAVVDIFVPLEAVVGRGSAPATISQRLREYVGAILRAL
jgi:hypothetical protein